MKANDIIVYVGRWDLLPEDWEGINGLYEATKPDIINELSREIDAYAETHTKEDNFMGAYTLEEFEDTFNQCLTHFLDSKTYWIKFF